MLVKYLIEIKVIKFVLKRINLITLTYITIKYVLDNLSHY